MIDWMKIRRRVALLVYPPLLDPLPSELGTIRVKGKALERLLEQRAVADRVRTLIARYEAWGGPDLDVPFKRFERWPADIPRPQSQQNTGDAA